MENDEKIENIKEKIFAKRPDLVMDRVPEKSKELFRQLARDDFCNDYGMTLKFLVDFYYGLIPSGTEHLELRLVNLEQQIMDLKQGLNVVPEQDKKRTLANGKVIGGTD